MFRYRFRFQETIVEPLTPITEYALRAIAVFVNRVISNEGRREEAAINSRNTFFSLDLVFSSI